MSFRKAKEEFVCLFVCFKENNNSSLILLIRIKAPLQPFLLKHLNANWNHRIQPHAKRDWQAKHLEEQTTTSLGMQNIKINVK